MFDGTTGAAAPRTRRTSGAAAPRTRRTSGAAKGRDRRGRLLAHLMALLLTAGALALAAPGTASAASLCGGRPTKTVPFATGELRLYKNRQYVCALVVAKTPGPRRAMSVSLQPRGGRAAVSSGRFTRQAGPVTVHALNRCVRASGTVDGRSGTTGWILC
ncbi:hypothetical protein [Streptomyces sp. NPDC008121]|uniref:hypothetical protein n=1 Tax=Streptomyces sp. NPDC008121 TaxID=3364809 RepID=UPI0036E7760A